jgi:hypothetical protein
MQALKASLAGLAASGSLVAHQLLLATASLNFFDAAVANIEVPLPESKTPASLLVEPGPIADTYAEEAKVAVSNPPTGATWLELGALGAGALAALGYGLKLSRNLPGIAGVIGSLGNMAYEAFAPDRVKAKDAIPEQAMAMAVQYGHAITTIAQTNPELAKLVATVQDQSADIAKRLGIHDAIVAALQEAKVGNPLLSRVDVSAPAKPPALPG